MRYRETPRCLVVKSVGEPYAGNLHVRFEEGGRVTPIPYSTALRGESSLPRSHSRDNLEWDMVRGFGGIDCDSDTDSDGAFRWELNSYLWIAISISIAISRCALGILQSALYNLHSSDDVYWRQRAGIVHGASRGECRAVSCKSGPNGIRSGKEYHATDCRSCSRE